ncbi:hypothetical protein ACOI1H_03880 [Loktanella sp. DJP18]
MMKFVMMAALVGVSACGQRMEPAPMQVAPPATPVYDSGMK